jgi:hypothetical protein
MLDGLSQALQCVQTECGHKALNLLGRSQLSTVHQFWGKERSNRVCGCFRCSGSQSYGGYYIILSCRTNTCLSLRSCTVGISRKSFENNPKNKHLELPTTVAQIITIQFYDSSKKTPLHREADLFERSCVYNLSPWVNPNEGQKKDGRVTCSRRPMDYWTLTTALLASGSIDLESTLCAIGLSKLC